MLLNVCSITTSVWFMCKITQRLNLHCLFSQKIETKPEKCKIFSQTNTTLMRKNGGAPVFVFSKVFSTFAYPHQFHSESGDIS